MHIKLLFIPVESIAESKYLPKHRLILLTLQSPNKTEDSSYNMEEVMAEIEMKTSGSITQQLQANDDTDVDILNENEPSVGTSTTYTSSGSEEQEEPANKSGGEIYQDND